FGSEDNAVENVSEDLHDCALEPDTVTQPQISLNAISGVNTFQTMRINAKSTIIKGSYPLQVTVPGGNFLTSNHVCKGVTWKLQREAFQADMMLIPLVEDGVYVSRKEGSSQGNSITCNAVDAGEANWAKIVFYDIVYEKVFAIPKSLPHNRKHDHRIPLQENTSAINIRPYRHPPIQKDAIEAIVNELLDTLNKKTVKDKFPIHIIEELIDELFGAQVFTKLDLRSGYHQIRMCEEDIPKTSFRTHQGHYEFLVMPFGLTNAPSSFQALMNEVFAPFLRKFVLVFFNDILVFSKDMTEHAKHLELVLDTMESQQLYAKMSKCVFGTTQVEYLGHVISGKGVSTDSTKNYAAISKPLTLLLKKNSFEWSDLAQQAFDDLKEAMSNAPRGYLLGRHFKIKTDHFSLKYLMEQRLSTPFQIKWLPKLLGYDYEILYKKGSENIVANALSRSPLPSLQSMIVSEISNDLLQRIQASWVTDLSIQQIIQKVKDGGNVESKFSWQDEQLRRHGRLVIGNNAQLRSELLKYYHNEPLGGHSGIWTDISMDFIESLPSSHGKTVIMVVVDTLSKYAHFVPMAHPFKAAQVAQLFLDTIYKLHGLPHTITRDSDRDKVFISHFWKELFKKLGVTLQLSSAYHPQTDGQTEVVNRCVECYLRCMTSEQPKEWVKWIALAEFWYNTNYHTAINTTPFEVVYGQKPPTHVSYMAGDSHVEAVDRSLVAREAAIALLQFHLDRAQQRMKLFADSKRSDRSFNVGDWVLLKLQPHRQVTLRMHKQHKFSPKFYGPFQVLAKHGTVAYKLSLPNTATIHDVFHVSQLKPYKGQTSTPIPLPLCTQEGLITAIPVVVLDRKIARVNNAAVVYWLVQW
ncbi:putative mitochondrial protein, partial [Tanacetum coccineum]